MDIRRLTFRIVGKNSKGQDLSPAILDIGEVKKYISDLEKFIKAGDTSKATPITLEYTSGSVVFTVQSTDSSILEQVEKELQEFQLSGDITRLNPKRAQIIHLWQNQSTKNGIDFIISSAIANRDYITISKDTSWVLPTDQWKDEELYVYGQINDMGGKEQPNIHLDTKEYGLLMINCTKENLKIEKRNRLYSYTGIEIVAKRNNYTGELKEPRFIKFVEYSNKFDATALNNFIKEGTIAWKDVDSVDWVRKLRNGYL